MRTNKIFIYVGKRGSGKTDFIKELIDYFPQPKTLCIDLFDNPVWRNMKTHVHPEWENRLIPAIPMEMIKNHKTGLYRTYSSDIDFLEELINKFAFNTALILEDATRWFGSKLTRNQRNYLLNCKQTNCDVHLFFHTLTSVPKELVKHCDYITIFKTGEYTFDKDKYGAPEFKHHFDKVLASNNKFENSTIRLQ